MDIVLAAMPWWIINRRSLSKKERVGVLVAMSMGVLYVFREVRVCAERGRLTRGAVPELLLSRRRRPSGPSPTQTPVSPKPFPPTLGLRATT